MSEIVLHGHPRSNPTFKVAQFLTLSQTPFMFRLVDLVTGAQKAAEYLEINRFGQVPAIEDGALKLSQSAAILHYLSDKTGQFGGRSDIDKARINEWMFWSFDILCPGLYRPRAIKFGFLKADESVLHYFQGLGERALTTLQQHLSKKDWLVGNAPTIADIDAASVLHVAPDGGYHLEEYPALVSYLARFKALPHYLTPAALNTIAGV